MTVWYAVTGAVILILGRKLFWLFVGLAGFFAGFAFIRTYLAVDSDLLLLLVGVILGLVGAVLAIVLERVAFALAGFYAGGYLVLALAEPFGYGSVNPALFFIGGIVAAAFAWVFMDWAIIVLSSLAGAGMIVMSFAGSPGASLVAFAALAAFGILVQGGLYRASKEPAGRDVPQ